jgi:hypothetical protein
MTKVPLLAALVATGCIERTEDYFVLDYEPRSLGAGLEYAFMPMAISCEPGQEFPYACRQRRASVDAVTATGAGEIGAIRDDGFTVVGREPGTALVDLRATVREDSGAKQLASTFEVPVVAIAYSQLGWYSSDFITEQRGAAFHSTTVTVWQHHYREPREELAGALTSKITAAELAGDAAFEIDRQTTSAALVHADGIARRTAELATGDTVGVATVRTTAGGAFELAIVDETAIARLEVEHQLASDLGTIAVRPFDAADRPIVGCPQSGPTITDTANAVVVETIEPSPWLSFCELTLGWAETPIDTTIVVRWGSRETHISIDVVPSSE